MSCIIIQHFSSSISYKIDTYNIHYTTLDYLTLVLMRFLSCVKNQTVKPSIERFLSTISHFSRKRLGSVATPCRAAHF